MKKHHPENQNPLKCKIPDPNFDKNLGENVLGRGTQFETSLSALAVLWWTEKWLIHRPPLCD